MNSNAARTILPPAVVLCLTATGLSVARSLALQGVRVFGFDGDPFQVGHFSSSFQKTFKLSCVKEPKILLEQLLRFAMTSPARPVLIPAGDDELFFLSQNAESLRKHYRFPETISSDFTARMLNKTYLYQCCERLGAQIPITYYPLNFSELGALAPRLPYPVIVKPALGHAWRKTFGGRKVLEAESPSTLLRIFENYRIHPREVVIQEIIPGPEDNIVVFAGYFNRDAEPVSVFTARKIRQYPPMFGSGSFCESQWIPEVADISMDLLRKMHYWGICGTEYKWDSRCSQWKLMEINFRPTLWFALTRASGVDIVYDAYLDLIGESPPPKIGSQKERVLWQYLVRDAASMFFYLRRGTLSSSRFRQFFSPCKEYAIISTRDWKVNIYYLFYALYQYFSHWP